MAPQERALGADRYRQVFVVRVYRHNGEPASALAGVMEEVGTGKRTPFHSGEELLEGLRKSVAAATPPGRAGAARSGDQG